MATSTSTKLGVVNNSLLLLGEREVTVTTENQASQLAAYCIQESLVELSSTQDWPFLIRTLDTDPTSPGFEVTFDNELMTLPDSTRIVGDIFYTLSGVNYQSYFEDYLTFTTRYALASFGEVDKVTRHTITPSGKLGLYPYPVTDADKSNLIVTVTEDLIFPIDDSDTFNMPEYMIPILTKLVCSKLASVLLRDFNLSQTFRLEYQELLSMEITKQIPNPTSLPSVL